MPRLAHISDIHFGKTFNVAIWNNVKQRIKEFRPTIIIASGDFTDSPDLLLLLAAKFELQDLCDSLDPKAEFFIVPGNHDVLDFGNIWHPGAAWLFERVMFSDTTDIRSNLEKSLDDKVGLNEKTLRWSGFPRTNRLNPRNWIWRSLGTRCDGRLQSCDYRRGNRQWPSKSIHDQTLITCFNSNSSAVREFVFATGYVEGDQITRTGSQIPHADCPCCKSRGRTRSRPDAESAILLRVAVLHHHPLPIAIHRALAAQRTEAKLEPFLVLKNGADLIRELQRQRYDLVLHGHKHRPQFASVELRADDLEGYPLLVLAGGSTAHGDEDPPYNTLRDIGTEPNGRLTARTFEQSELMKDRIYREPLPALKRRAFVGAIERAKISAEQLLSEVIIDGVGHLRSLDRTSGLTVRKDDYTLEGMVINVTLPLHGKRTHIALEEDCRGKVTLNWVDQAGNSYGINQSGLPEDVYCWLGIIQPLRSGSEPLTFGIKETTTNSISMSRWEIDERARHRGDSGPPSYTEKVGFNITYPVERILLHLEFPRELDGITPAVSCHRHPASPNFPLRFRREERPCRSSKGPDYLEDKDLANEEAKRLRYEARDRRWILEIDRPIPGNQYTLEWSVPDLVASEKAVQFTLAYQGRLMALAGKSATPLRPGIAEKCQEIFLRMADELMKRFRSDINPDEKMTAFLMVYDGKDLCLRPALKHISEGAFPAGSYELPLGDGVAGAAFLGRKILTWKNDPASGSLIRPQPDNLNSKWVLALPIYYQEEHEDDKEPKELKMETQPGALIGVVTLGSDEISSRIPECYEENKPEVGRIAQQFAQSCVFEILNVLSRRETAPKP